MSITFRSRDMVQCKVLRNTVVARQDVRAGDVVEVTGWTARQLISGANPALEVIKGAEVKPYVERDTEVVVTTSDPQLETVGESEESKLARFKRDAAKKAPVGGKKKA